MRYAVINTPVGPLTLASNEEGLCGVSFGITIPAAGIVDEHANQAAIHQLSQYFQGSRTSFDLPLNLKGTSFQLSVWRALLEIPYGETRTYGEIAKAVANPNAARAVGMANHENRIAIVVPCHRVVGQNGTLTGYAAGIEIKRHLLAIEQRNPGSTMSYKQSVFSFSYPY